MAQRKDVTRTCGRGEADHHHHHHHHRCRDREKRETNVHPGTGNQYLTYRVIVVYISISAALRSQRSLVTWAAATSPEAIRIDLSIFI